MQTRRRWPVLLAGVGLLCSGLLLWRGRMNRSPAVDVRVAGDEGAGHQPHAHSPPIFAQDDSPTPAAAPAVDIGGEPAAVRVAVMMKRWREAIIVQDEETVLAINDAFRQNIAEVIEPLKQSARGDSEPRVRAFSTRVLGMLKASEAVDVLRTLLKDESEFVRHNAAWALGELADRDSAREIARLHTQDRSPMVREAAGKALERL